MRAVYLALALMGSAAVDAASMDSGVSGGDVLARCQALLLASSPSTASASASAYSKLTESSLPSDITAALATHALQWAQLPHLARVGLLWAHGYVVNSVADSVSIVKVYTSCGATTASAATSEDARGVSMDQISLSSSAFASTQCLSNTCGVYHQSTNTNCGSDLPAQLLCAVEQISSSGTKSVPTATGSFWSDAGDDSTEAPFPQIYSHTVPVSRNVTTTAGSSVPSDVTFTSIHMTTKGVDASPSCSTTGDTVIPCLQLTGVSSTGSSHAFCRPQIDAARLEAFLTATKTQLQKSSSLEATTISNGATDGSSSSSGLSTGAILGIAGGALVVLGILAFYFLRRKKTQGDGYHADRDGGGGGFGRKSVGPRASGNGQRPNANGNANGNEDKMGATRFARNDSTFPIIDRAADNESVISTDYYQENNKQDADNNQRPRAGSRPPFLSKNTSGSSGGSSRGAMYGKTVEEYSEESETIREFLTDPQILMRRIPYEELTPLRLLSKGSYGEVFLAQLETRHVATKRLLPEKKTLTRSIEQFTAEIQLMCQLEHRNIVSFVGVSWDHLQNLSAVVEYMDNGDLAEVLARSKGRFTWQKEKISISMDVAEGLVYLHSMRPVVVHRDLKSKNVLLNKRGQAKLSDFGVSRKTTVNETMTSGVGTLLWTAPEIIEGRKYSEKADIFSLGVVLSEIDTCDMPYAGVTDEYGDRLPGMQIVQMVRLGELKVSLELDCPSRLRELVLQCTSLDPDLRPTSMEVAYTLKSIIAPSLRV